MSINYTEADVTTGLLRKYTTERDEVSGLLRITAARDVRPGVPAGTSGGLIKSEANLSHDGKAWVHGDAQVYDDARVFGNAGVSGKARVSGNAQVYDDAWVSGYAQVYGEAQVSGNAQVYDEAHVFGSAWVYGDARVFGNSWVFDHTQVYGYAEVSGDAQVFDNSWVYGNAQIYGKAYVSGNAEVERPDHCTVIHPTASADVVTTAVRTADGTMRVHVGCWTGTPADLHTLADADSWPSGCYHATREKYRPRLHALADYLAAVEAGWDA